MLSVAATPVFSITAITLTVTAEDKSKCYDGSIYTGGYTVTYSGFVNGEDQGVLGGALVFGGTAPAAVVPGSYTIIPSGLTAVNYIFNYVNGTLLIDAAPAPTITGPNSLCAGSSGIQYYTETGYSNYTWTISYGGVITAGLNSAQVTVDWGTAGSRSISVNYYNSDGCSSVIPTNYNVTVLSVPVPIISGVDSVCSGATGVVYSTQVSYTNYVWMVSAGGTITSGAGTNSITVSWTGSGNQTVSVSYTNQLGCQSLQPTVFNVAVTPKPAAVGAVIGSSAVCAGVSGEVYSVTPVANALSYEWTIPTGASIVAGAGTSSITVNFATNAISGIIKVSGVNECGTGTSSPNFNVQVNPIPSTPVITQHFDTLISSANNGNQWYKNGVAISGATAKTYVVTEDGTYHVVVTLLGCSSAPSNTILMLNVSVGEPTLATSFNIYPNPSNGFFNIKVESAVQEVYDIEIYNNLGALVWKQDAVTIDGSFTSKIDLNGSPSGIYTVALRNKANSIVKKVIIMR